MNKIRLLFTLFISLLFFHTSSKAQVVISQVYGGGGNTGATLKNDFIELFNKGTVSVSLAGWSVQYGSSTGTGNWIVTSLTSVSLAPGQYYLIQQAAGTGGTTNLPTPDATGTTAMAGSNGKVALVNNTTALSGACPVSSAIQDIVGYGTANCSETTPTAALTNSTAALRNTNGCTDSGNNSSDFTVTTPNPRNTSSPLNTCGGSPVISASAAAGKNLAEPSTTGNFIINLSANAPAGGTTISYNFLGSGATLGTDFSDAFGGTVTIAAGINTDTINLSVIDDIDFEGTESIMVTLTSATNGVIIGTASTTISIIDNESDPNINLGNTPYCQDFNTLAITGTSSTVPNGWGFSESGSNASTSYTANNGSSTSGDTYSYGTTSATDRAFGTLQSGSLISTLGAQFKNTTGGIISKLKVTYKGEEWRLGTASRKDSLFFQISTDATSLTTGTWTRVNRLDFATPNSTTTGSKDGNDPSNSSLISYTIRNLSIPADATFYIRWQDFNASGADDGLAIDDFCIQANPVDNTAPMVTTLSPVHLGTDVPLITSAAVTFDEEIMKGAGNILVKKSSDNSVIQSIDINATTLNFNAISFNLVQLDPNTSYYIELPAGVVKDLDNNSLAFFNTWSFTTGITLFTSSFNACGPTLQDGFTQYSEIDPTIVWACTSFGRDPNDLTGTLPLASGLQINGFTGGTNVPNLDWLISPSFNLTNTAYPLLKFWSRAAFNGSPLELKVSTNYIDGTNPASATWTDINGKFPSEGSDIWSLSENINLTAFKATNVHFAFVYTSTIDEGARWTLDDISVLNSPTPPPASITVNPSDLSFAFAPVGSQSFNQFTVTGNDLVNDITISSSGVFTISKDGVSYSNAINFTVAEANNLSKTVYVKFMPTIKNQNFTGSASIVSGPLNYTVSFNGTSIDPATTLEVVNWNIEWFGSAGNGPTNDEQQKNNVINIFQSVNADIYALSEIVDTSRLRQVVNALNGYSMVVSNFGSHTNTSDPEKGPLSEAQKLAFVYKNSLFSNVSTTPLLSLGVNSAADLTNPAWNWWSSGRFPYMLTADVTLNCVTKNVKFIVIHAKANTSPTATSYDRRKKGADTLHHLLTTMYPNDPIILLGDYNDDLDQSITAGFITTSWNIFKTDTNFSAITLPLSLAGKESTVSHDDVIDHVIISDELIPCYLNSSATILTEVATLVNNYGNSTSDHYPVLSRFLFSNTTAPSIATCIPNQSLCINNSGTYTIPTLNASDDCNDPLTYEYTITGVTSRSGSTNNASGTFSPGISYIQWKVTDTWGNMTTCTTQVKVNAKPACTITTSTPFITAKTIYLGYGSQSAVLTANATGTGPFTFTWSGATALSCTNCSSTTFTPTQCGVYIIQALVSDANSCTSTCTYTITVIDARVAGQDKVYFCHNGNTISVSVNAAAAQLALGSTLGACNYTCTPGGLASDLESRSLNNFEFKVYPNPARERMSIEFTSNDKSTATLYVRNISGQILYQNRSVLPNTLTRLTTDFAQGIYFVELVQGTKRKTVKWVKM